MPARHRLFTLGAALVAFGALSACDAGQGGTTLEVKVFSPGDGRGTLTLRTLPTATDNERQELATQLVGQLGLGTLAGPATPMDGLSDSRGYALEGLDTERVQVEVAPLLAIAGSRGITAADGIFVSLCTSVTTGRASTTTAEVTHLDSCAVWSSADERRSDTAVLALRFEARRSPATSSTVYLGIVVAIGVASAVIASTSQRARRRSLARLAAGTAMLVAGGIGIVSLVWAVRLRDPLPDTGQVFDTDLAAGSLTMAGLSVLCGVALPAAVFVVRRWLSRRWRG